MTNQKLRVLVGQRHIQSPYLPEAQASEPLAAGSLAGAFGLVWGLATLAVLALAKVFGGSTAANA